MVPTCLTINNTRTHLGAREEERTSENVDKWYPAMPDSRCNKALRSSGPLGHLTDSSLLDSYMRKPWLACSVAVVSELTEIVFKIFHMIGKTNQSPLVQR